MARWWIGCGIVIVGLLATPVFAQQVTPSAKPASKPAEGEKPKASEKGPNELDDLALRQSRMADKYARLEDLLSRMATFEGSSNPRRAALLKQALSQSKDRLTLAQLNKVVALLNQNTLDKAISGQGTVDKDLKALLDLLQSENRADRLKSEQARIKEYIKDLERLIRLEKSIQGQTEGGADQKQLSEEQQKIANRTQELAKRIQENEEGGVKKPSEDNDSKNEDSPPGDKDDNKKDDGKKDGDKKNGDKADKDPSKNPSDKKDDKKDSDKKDGDKKDPDKKDGDKKDNKSPNADKPNDSNSKPNGDPSKADKNDGDKKDGDKKDGDKKDSDKKDGDKKDDKKSPDKKDNKDDKKDPKNDKNDSKDDKKQDSPMKDGDSKDSQDSPKKDSKKPSSPPKPGGDQQDQKQAKKQQDKQQENPARKRIEAAEERMREAEKKLAEAKRKEAVEEQEKAKEELEKAKAELEEILRQMREEEIERTLAQLEGRFRKMLEMQLKVYESTKRLDKIAVKQRGEEVVILSGRLGSDERRIAFDADKALNLLREEGSSIALPETVEQIREDMEQVASRLDRTEVGSITQNIEEDIIAALEEIIEALQKAQKDQENKKQQQQQQQQQGQEQDQPLVDKIAELKMIRSLQMRVNNRTKRYSRLLDNEDDPTGNATDKDLRQALGKLGEREESIQRITRDIVLGKNK